MLGLILAFAASTCSDGPTGPQSGRVLLALAGAGASDRALLLEITGADTSARIDTIEVAPGSSYRLFARALTPQRWRVIVTGNIANGTLVQVIIPNRSKAGSYSGTVLDVADATFDELAPGVRALSVAP